MSNNYYCWDKVSHNRIQATMTNEKILAIVYPQIESCILSQVLTEFLGFSKILQESHVISQLLTESHVFSYILTKCIIFSHFSHNL